MPPIINDEGVSEIIAIILIAVVTIVLAGLFATYSYGLAKDIKQQDYVAVTVDRIDSNTISIMYAGGNVDSLVDSGTFTIKIDGSPIEGSGNLGKTPGSISQYVANSDAHVVVVGLCKDGTAKVLFDGIV